MAQTDRLGLPLMAAGQAQKEITHNEALSLIDIAVQLVVESADLATPPASPVPGQCWIVASGADGSWFDQSGRIASWTTSGWLFAVPKIGWGAWVSDRANGVRFDGTDWIDEGSRSDGYYVNEERIVGARQASISSPTGGAIQDSQARTAVDAMLAVLRAHGLIDA